MASYVLLIFLPKHHYLGYNHKFALEQKDFVTSAVLDLLVTGCILKVDKRPFICSPLAVVEGSSKKRLVVNLRYLNSFLWKQKFRYEDLHTALLLCIKGDIWLSPLISNLRLKVKTISLTFTRIVRNTLA